MHDSIRDRFADRPKGLATTMEDERRWSLTGRRLESVAGCSFVVVVVVVMTVLDEI